MRECAFFASWARATVFTPIFAWWVAVHFTLATLRTTSVLGPRPTYDLGVWTTTQIVGC